MVIFHNYVNVYQRVYNGGPKDFLNCLRISQYFFRRFPSENIFLHRLSKSKDKSPKPFRFHRVLPLKYGIPNGNYHILMVTNINETHNIHGNYMVITHKKIVPLNGDLIVTNCIPLGYSTVRSQFFQRLKYGGMIYNRGWTYHGNSWNILGYTICYRMKLGASWPIPEPNGVLKF